MTPMETVAFCDKCGRGYCYVNEENGPHGCMDGRCWGHIRMLTVPEPSTDDDECARRRRLDTFAVQSSYVRGPHVMGTAAPGPQERR